LCLLSFSFLWASAQTKIEGWVKDSKNRPLIGANISVKAGYDGAVTDSSGHYHFATVDTGSDTLVFSMAGYETVERVVVLTGAPLSINVQLKAAFNELSAVRVTAGTFSAGDNKKGVVL